MIRWWDYVAVFFYADFMQAWLFLGFTATTWYMPLIAGLVVGFLWHIWRDFYCRWRLNYEERQDERF